MTHLNAGTGDPCAGQRSARLWPVPRWTVTSLYSNENLGFAPPTGSITMDYEMTTHLYAGMGDP